LNPNPGSTPSRRGDRKRAKRRMEYPVKFKPRFRKGLLDRLRGQGEENVLRNHSKARSEGRPSKKTLEKKKTGRKP